MMKIKDLLNDWTSHNHGERTTSKICLHLPLKQLAQIMALNELFPEQGKEHIIADLLASSLDQLEETLPYVKGNKIITEDEFGDPVYEDVGLTPRFLELSKKHLKQLQSKKN